MDISAGLIAKIAAGGTAAAATTTAGLIYGEDILKVFFGEDKAVEEKETKEQHRSGEPSGKESLGLGDIEGFDLPSNPNENKEFQNLGSDKLKKINFDGKESGDLIIGGDASSPFSLIIEKVSDGDKFPQGYKFIFKTTSESGITVGKDGNNTLFTLKKGMDLEFKIKELSGKWSLEKAWKIAELAAKAGMSNCETGNKCTFDENKTFNVKDGNGKISGVKITGSKKLKFEGDQKDYNQGFKFTAEEDHALDGVSGGEVTKLKKGATYEIKEENEGGTKKWFLIKKTPSTKEQEIEKINEKLGHLGIPSTCRLSGEEFSKTCENLNETDLKGIKFEDKSSEDLTITPGGKFTLNIKRPGLDADSFGAEKLKFSFSDSSEVKTSTSQKVIFKKGTNPEFKIKGSGTNLTLEKAWNVAELSKKIGLTSCFGDEGSTECSSFSGTINVYESSGKWITGATISSTSGAKLSFVKEQENYNQGFKFTFDKEITLNGGNKTGFRDEVKIGAYGSLYEIKKQTVNNDKKWFLSKVTSPRT